MNTTKLAEEYAQQTFDKNDPRYPQLVQDFKDVIKKALSKHPTPASVGKDTESTFSLLRPETPATASEDTALVREIAEESGIEFSDERVRYVTVQMTKSTWYKLQARYATLSQRPTPATDTPEQIRELHLAAAKLAGAPATASEPLGTKGVKAELSEHFKPDSASAEKFQVKCRNCGQSWFIDIPAATPSGGGEWTEETVLEITENVSTVKPTRVARKAIADAHNQSLQPRDCGEDTALLDFAERYLGTIARFELVEVYHRIHGNLLAKGDNIRTAIHAAMKEQTPATASEDEWFDDSPAAKKPDLPLVENYLRMFVQDILHGDEDHRKWLLESVECFIEGKHMPERP